METVLYRAAYALSGVSMLVILASPASRARTGLSQRQAVEIALMLLASFIVGARAWFVVADAVTTQGGHRGLSFYLAHPGEAFATAHGGMSIHGGLLCAFVCGILVTTRWRSVVPGYVADDAILQAPPFIALGRVATFLHGGLPGKPTPFAWGYRTADGVLRWPWHLIEAASMVGVFALLVLVRRRDSLAPFGLLGTFLVAYGSVRLVTDALREDARFMWLTVPQWASLAAIIIGITLVRRRSVVAVMERRGP